MVSGGATVIRRATALSAGCRCGERGPREFRFPWRRSLSMDRRQCPTCRTAAFYPLSSDDLTFRLGNDVIRAAVSCVSGERDRVTDVSIPTAVDGAGEALLDVPGIRFGSAIHPTS